MLLINNILTPSAQTRYLLTTGDCMVKHCLPSLSQAIKDTSKAKTRIPFLWQCFLSLQNHAPQILETACKYDKDHNQSLSKPQHVYYKNVGNG